MKKKKTTAAPAVNKAPAPRSAPKAPPAGKEPAAPAAPAAVQPTGLVKPEWLWLALFGCVLFTASAIFTGRATMCWLGLALIVTLGFGLLRKNPFAALREHLSLPVFGFLALFLMVGLAGIYSPFEDRAVSVNYLIFAALSMAGIVLLRARRRHVQGLLWTLLGVVTAVAVISMDFATINVITPVYEGYYTLWGMEIEITGIVANRLNSIFNNANMAASLYALAMLLGLYLLRRDGSRKSRLIAAMLLGVNAVAFWLSVSRGAILCFAIALLAWLIAAGKGERFSLFVTLLLSALTTLVCGSVGLAFLRDGSPIPLLMSLACGVVIYLLDTLLTRRITALMAGREKWIAISSGVIAALCGVFLIAALTVQGPYTFETDGVLTRKISLEPGEYTVSGRWDDGVRLSVYVEEEADLLLDRGEVVLEAELTEGMTVSIPGGARSVLLYFDGKAGQTLSDVTFSDGTSVKLNRTLLPEVLEFRLQDDIFTSSSFLLRVQYMKDALKLWSTSPLYGRGLSSTENLYYSVQPIYYDSMYVHNHILQYMSDMGLLGLAAFLLWMGGALWLLIRRLRKGADPLAAVLVACWVMMNAHGLMELCFSVRGYLVSAMTLVAVMVVAFGEPPVRLDKKTLKTVTIATASVFWVLVLVFGGLLLSYRMAQKDSMEFKGQSQAEFMLALESFIARDVYCDDYHKMLYVANGTGHPDYHGKAARYAAQLRRDGTYTYCSGVGEYYYLPQGLLSEYFACSREGIAQRASAAQVWNEQLDRYRLNVLPMLDANWMTDYLEGVLATADYLAEYEVGRYESIQLSEENAAFIEEIRTVYKQNLSGEEAYERLMLKYHPEQLAQEQAEAAQSEEAAR